MLLMEGAVGHVSRSGHYYDPIPALLPWGIAASALCFAFAAAGVWLQYYYVVDFQGQCLRNQFKFFGLQRDTVVLRSKDIVGITTQGKKVTKRYEGIWWTYRVVAVSSTGRLAAMSDWRREGIQECNAEAGEFAQKLGCSYSAPPNVLGVTDKPRHNGISDVWSASRWRV